MLVHLSLIHRVGKLLLELRLPLLLHHVLLGHILRLLVLLNKAILLLLLLECGHVVRRSATLRVVTKVEIGLVHLAIHAALEVRLEWLLVHHVLLSHESVHLIAVVLHRGVVVFKGDVYVQDHHGFVKLDEGFRLEICNAFLLSLQRGLVPRDLLDDLEIDLEFDERDARRLDNLTAANEALRLLVLQVVVQAAHLPDLVIDVATQLEPSHRQVYIA